MEKRTYEADLDLASQDHVEDFFRVAGADDEAHIRQVVREALQERGEDVGADSRRCPDRKLSRAAAGELLHVPATLLDRVERAHGPREKRPPRVGEAHAGRSADEERYPELLLEALDARRQRRLGDEELARRLPELLTPCDLDEAFDLRQAHS